MIKMPNFLLSFLKDTVADVITKQLEKIKDYISSKREQKDERESNNKLSSLLFEYEKELRLRLNAIEDKVDNIDFVLAQGKTLFEKTLQTIENQNILIINGDIHINIFCNQQDDVVSIIEQQKVIETHITKLVDEESKCLFEINENTNSNVHISGISKDSKDRVLENFNKKVRKLRGDSL